MTRCLEAIAAEGSTVEDHNGKTVTNPALSAYTQMGNRRDSMCRALRIFTLANNSQAVKSATDASARRNAQTLIEGDSGDPFEEMLR